MIKYQLLILFAYLFLSSCTQNNKTIYTDDLVLKIGNCEYYGFNLKTDLDNIYSIYQTKYGTIPPEDSILSELNTIINRMYLSAEAYTLKLDTVAEVEKLVNGMSNYQMTKVEGSLWKKTVDPYLQFTESDLNAAYEKMKKVYYITICQFSDSTKSFEFIGKFRDLDSTSLQLEDARNIDFSSSDVISTWPFFDLKPLKIDFTNLKENDIIDPIFYDNKYFLLRINKISKVNIESFKFLKKEINEKLKQSTVYDIITEKKSKMDGKMNIKIHDDIFSKVLTLLKENQKIADSDIAIQLGAIKNDVLFEYSNIDAVIVKTTAIDFLNFYYYKPLRLSVNDSIELYNEIYEYVNDDYLWKESVQLGLDKSSEHKYGTLNYKTKMLNPIYLEKIIKPTLHIEEKEVKLFYENNIQTYSTPVKGNFFKVEFKSSLEAYKAIDVLDAEGAGEMFKKFKNNDFTGIVSINEAFIIDYSSVSVDIKYLIIEQSVNHAQVIEHDGKHTLLYKLNEEIDPKPYNSVREEVIEYLKMERLHKMENEIASKLKEKYELILYRPIDELIHILPINILGR